jgi:pSer/pThr/pTyr-binding forkhead associated (FHA) protein
MTESIYQLLMQRGPQPGKLYPLTSVSIVIGRDPMADITITDPEVSRQHARLFETAKGYQIQDLGSTNGTFVAGQRLGSDPLPLQPGQVITLGGSVALVYRMEGAEDDVLATMLDGDLIKRQAPEAAPPAAEAPADDKTVEAPEPEAAAESIDESVEVVESEPVAEETVEEALEEAVEETAEPFADFTTEPETSEEFPEPEAFETLAPEAAEPPTELDFAFDARAFEQPPAAESRSPIVEPLPPLPEWGQALVTLDEPALEEKPGRPSRLAKTADAPADESPRVAPAKGGKEDKRRRRNTIIAVSIFLLLCCCCSFILFVYYIGGDWLLRELGLI